MKDVDRAAKKVRVVWLIKYVKLTPFHATESHIRRLRGRERWGRAVWCERLSIIFHINIFEPHSNLLQCSNGLTKVDSELARLRCLLEKKYANDHDAGYTYIDPITSDSVPLTPFMMKEWARAMVISLLIHSHWYWLIAVRWVRVRWSTPIHHDFRSDESQVFSSHAPSSFQFGFYTCTAPSHLRGPWIYLTNNF